MKSGHVNPDDRAAALRMVGVSHETVVALDAFVELFLRWQKAVQLVSPSSLPKLWTRHIADSLQLVRHIPEGTKTVVDLGSGGGFPGLILAIALRDKPEVMVHLIESDSRKASFLREAVRGLQLPAKVHAERIESVAKRIGNVDVVSARSLAPLPRLFELAEPLLAKGTIGLFLKGQDVDRELTEAAKSWNIHSKVVPSLTDSSGKILLVEALSKAAQ
jgi:16S rRNA (guanine527-N7)-methyltransferase